MTRMRHRRTQRTTTDPGTGEAQRALLESGVRALAALVDPPEFRDRQVRAGLEVDG